VTAIHQRLSRRYFLRTLAGAAGLAGTYASWPRFAGAASTSPYPFEEVLASASHITWVHTAGKSPQKYLPETTGAGCAFLDYDNDGRLDLFVCNFVDFNKAKNLNCVAYNKPGYCVPTLYKPAASWLFHNNGDGTFTDVSQSSGIAKHLGKAWGVVATDLNNDGKMDLFVANDTVQNYLYMNRGNGKFEEIAALAGVGFSESGRPRSGMGVDSADFNQDGWMDLFVANIDHERFSLYQNNRDETFDDQANATSVGAATRLLSGWGLKFFDYDNDGNLDLFLANGNPDDMIETMQKDVTYREKCISTDLAEIKKNQ